jgi:hypothetical protein
MDRLILFDSSMLVSGVCIDDKHAYIYQGDWPDLLVFASVSKDTFVTDSVIDFNHSFTKYANVEEYKQINKYPSDDELEQSNYIDYTDYIIKITGRLFHFNLNRIKSGKYPLQEIKNKRVRPAIYKKKDHYLLAISDGVYEISFQNRGFVKTIKFKKRMFRFTVKHCDDSIMYIKDYQAHEVHFFPEYTKIKSHIKRDDSYVILHDNGEITTNIEPVRGHCKPVYKLISKTKKEIGNEKSEKDKELEIMRALTGAYSEKEEDDDEWEEIAVFGMDCERRETIIEFPCDVPSSIVSGVIKKN